MKHKAKSKEQRRCQTVKVTMPVSVTRNGNVKEPNDITVRRNGPRYRSRLLLYALCSLLIAFWGCATTSSVKGSSQLKEALITGIDIQDHTVTLTVNKPFVYTIFRSDDPYKIVIELPDVSIGAFNNRIVSDKAGITEIVPSQVGSPSFMARLEMLLQTPSMVEPEYKNNTLIIRIKKEELPIEVKEEKELEEVKEAKEEGAEIPLPKATEITNILFEKSAEIVKVLIKGNGSMTPSVFPLDNYIVIDIPDVVMNVPLPSAVISPLKGIRSGKYKDKIRLVFDLKEKTDFDVAAIGDSIVIALSPPIAQMAEEKIEAAEITPITEGRYTGKKISLDFQDADIIPIFRLLADISGYNIVVSPEVKGKLTMKLINVPWDQALDLILKTFSLGKSVEGNIIRIAPHTVFTRESEEAAKAKEAEIKAEPLDTKIFPISYADVSDVEKAVKDSKILTPRGSISVDKRTSSMVINDVPSVFPQIENLLTTLDKPTPQVMIEARIVEVNTSDVRDLGIQWGFFLRSTDNLISFRGLSGLGAGPFTGSNFLVDFPATVSPGSGS
ncbi:MAG: secretin N-terminal domain-containing protein, partial [Nitrospirota bacterium]